MTGLELLFAILASILVVQGAGVIADKTIERKRDRVSMDGDSQQMERALEDYFEEVDARTHE